MPKLTEKAIDRLTVPAGKREAWLSDADVVGLRVRAMAGAKTFYACWTDRATGERRREKLGFWGALTLDKARETARGILGDVAKGEDPEAKREARRAEAERDRAERALTLETLVDDWSKLHLAGKRPRYAAEAVRAIKHAFAADLSKPAARLSRAEAVNTLDALTKAGKVAIAGRTLAYGRACYTWAQKRGKVAGNPFAGLPIPAGVTARERALTDDELGRVWTAAKGMDQPFGTLFRVLLLTLARREEVAGMRWSEVSADLSTWTIPGARMKRGAAHVVALPEAARDALRTVRRIEGQDLVFSTTGKTPVSGFTKAKAALDKAAKVTGWRLHDMRRSGVSGLAAMGFNPVVADKLLAHQPSTLHGAARVYQRHDFAEERARALEAWAAHVLRCAERKPEGETGNVAVLAEQRARRRA
ncbi:MAG TPA: site-specific integrase [Falsiroseomonas sp.]|jgi:integrase|nr:site-specific integrase [Falsiroseomonas sp.]